MLKMFSPLDDDISNMSFRGFIVRSIYFNILVILSSVVSDVSDDCFFVNLHREVELITQPTHKERKSQGFAFYRVTIWSKFLRVAIHVCTRIKGG